ncbi:DUF6252 family protein [Flavobacterium silvaticum]|uniref:Lipoprotein n=1 Tax=Flavobacterium silvaticum TaxID=1852020 RepID=A0A972FIS6_9FLAO|nr:DUF6252 family protein [Flavobacterium silvaticum]NMH26731.1 hypothetical protein [Flavobacterium silvaticum]
MKKFQIFGKAILFTGLIALASACNGDEAVGTGGQSGSYITASVNGSGFEAAVMGVSTVTAVRTGTGAGNLIMITGANPDAHAITINLFGITATGDYNVTPDSDSVMAYVDGMGSSTASYDTGECEGATGVVHVTQISDTQIEGTFEFTGKSEENSCAAKSVTNGSFRGIFMQ